MAVAQTTGAPEEVKFITKPSIFRFNVWKQYNADEKRSNFMMDSVNRDAVLKFYPDEKQKYGEKRDFAGSGFQTWVTAREKFFESTLGAIYDECRGAKIDPTKVIWGLDYVIKKTDIRNPVDAVRAMTLTMRYNYIKKFEMFIKGFRGAIMKPRATAEVAPQARDEPEP